ncbi:carboxypeptidase-like regulatory domain-containing protein [Pontibacter virosus]|uniref:Carboxypeptidase family protein n=1 Tax=Pontibacter virosus TaxID=1765052 RepID=A0A2U1ATB0_9BACT|nr:carboxypeptidase-like regulatory domain-containing protein [Pontibacter virosus]PVY39507.1 hypothetical protein C8E01_111114 [Pontibacter virosus]
MRYKIHLIILLLLLLLTGSCERYDVDIFTIEGYVTDELNQPVAGIAIGVDAVKTPSGMGIITDGKRKSAGNATTQENGYYSAKLKVFKDADRLEVALNENMLDGYTYRTESAYLPTLNSKGKNTLNFTLYTTAILRIKFVNTKPASDNDTFKFYYYGIWTGKPHTRKMESCATVQENDNFQWIGKDVCGIYTVEAIVGDEAPIVWYVTKNGETKEFRATILIERGVVNEYLIQY